MGKRGPLPDSAKRETAAAIGENRAKGREIGYAPGHLDEECVELWSTIVEQAPPGLLTIADRMALEQLVENIAGARRARAVIRAQGEVIQAQNGPARNPACLLLNQYQGALAKGFAELGLTPQARARMGVNGDGESERDGLDDLIGA
jgi:P27 family predicted phage terminase small subunit